MDRIGTALAEIAATAATRRARWLAVMAAGRAAGATCDGCTGTCCTFVANSMAISPVEALDAWQALEIAGALTGEFRARLQKLVADQGLDRPPAGDGRRTFGRRRYTCPLHTGTFPGCPLPFAAKPYGCLAFNPVPGGARERDCRGDAGDESSSGESRETDDRWRRVLAAGGLDFERLPIPVALLAVWRWVDPGTLPALNGDYKR